MDHSPPISYVQTVQHSKNVASCLDVVIHAPSVCTTGPSQKKDLSPDCGLHPIKLVKGVSIVNHCLFAPGVESVPSVVETLPVGGRLQLFWRTWTSWGSSPRVVSILKEGSALPFKIKPPLTRSPMIVSSYANPLRDFHLQEPLHSLLQKLVVEKVRVRSSLAFYNRLFLVPKPHNQVASHTGSKHLEPIPEGKGIQDGYPRVHTAVV